MTRPLDVEARAELLCFLVAGQLFAFAREGVWLRTDHLIELAQIWLASNGAEWTGWTGWSARGSPYPST
ncbi:hypothetical protein [Paraburkholderia flagellata]|uniref:hypothetical protein n=1 Tax=Paraburkholderia flagellata TaxID=2883241 RepID=UPI001F419264|nr:hypothetical protein [Paraburkholderia flagellata]